MGCCVMSRMTCFWNAAFLQWWPFPGCMTPRLVLFSYLKKNRYVLNIGCLVRCSTAPTTNDFLIIKSKNSKDDNCQLSIPLTHRKKKTTHPELNYQFSPPIALYSHRILKTEQDAYVYINMIDTYFLYFSIYIDVCIYIYTVYIYILYKYIFCFCYLIIQPPHGACPVTAQALSQKTFPGSNRVGKKR